MSATRFEDPALRKGEIMEKRRSGRDDFFAFLAFLALLILMAAVVSSFRQRGGSSLGGGLAVGELAPAIEAQGWLNGPPPDADDLAGKVLVIHAWASW